MHNKNKRMLSNRKRLHLKKEKLQTELVDGDYSSLLSSLSSVSLFSEIKNNNTP